MQLSKKTLLVSLLSLSLFALAVTPILALELKSGLPDVQLQTQFGEQELTVTVGKIIKLVLGFLGLVALILFIVGGFKWMTSGGNEENISEAKKLMSAAVVGLFIIIIAYAATTFIINKLTETTETGVAGCNTGTFKCVNGTTATANIVPCVAETKEWSPTPQDCVPADKFCKLETVGSEAEICIYDEAQ